MSSLDEDKWLTLEREYRRQVKKAYYRREDDFENLQAYNDYLEEVESLIAGLIDDKTRPEARRRLDILRASGNSLTAKNHALFDQDRKAIELKVTLEKRQQAERAQERIRAEEQAAEERMRIKQALQEKVSHGMNIAHARDELKIESMQAKVPDTTGSVVAVSRYVPAAQRPSVHGDHQLLSKPVNGEMLKQRESCLISSAMEKRESFEDDPELLNRIRLAGGYDSDLWRRRYREEAFDQSAWLVVL